MKANRVRQKQRRSVDFQVLKDVRLVRRQTLYFVYHILDLYINMEFNKKYIYFTYIIGFCDTH